MISAAVLQNPALTRGRLLEEMRNRRKLWIAIAVVAGVAIALAFFEWNWLRGPISSYLSARWGRSVAINGDLRVELSTKPRLFADAVTLDNMPGAKDPVMARVQRVAVRIDLLSIFGDTISVPELALFQPRVLLERGADGHGNWELLHPTRMPDIGWLNIEDGAIHFVDSGTATDFTLTIKSTPASATNAMPVHFSGNGRLRNAAFSVDGEAATLLALDQGDRPYRLNARMRAGDSRIQFDGTVVPNRPENVDGALTLQGRDLSQLYPIVPVPFPWSPPYRLNGQLRHAGKVWTFHDFTGKVGNSDIAGRFAVDVSQAKPLVDADLVSTRLDYRDLGGLVGLPPSEPSTTRSAAQNKEAAKRQRSERVLPTRPYDLDKFRAVDAHVRFKGKRFMASNLPLDDMTATVVLKDAMLKLEPLDFGVAGGHVTSALTLDAGGKIIKTEGDVTVRNVELKQLVPAVKPPNGSAGKVGGRARFTATGNSIADMAASANGDVALISRGGDSSALAVVLTNLDLARAVPLMMRGDANTPIHCMVADFVAEDGTVLVRTLVMDTEAEKIVGDGAIDLAGERYDLTLTANSKRPSMFALRGPIVVGGTFKSPRAHPAVGPIAARVGASIALGVALTPFAALLPLIDVGGSADADCGVLVKEAQDNVRPRVMPTKSPLAQAR
ncbi:MAG: AsmA family protein [Casimicrobiaceae bacterium]